MEEIENSQSSSSEIRVGLIGCGRHASLNILPAFSFTPLRLVATCDHTLQKAQKLAENFGAPCYYDDVTEMMEKTSLDAVLVIVSRNQNQIQYLSIIQSLQKYSVHIWIEKPPADNLEDIRSLIAIQSSMQNILQVGFKTMFMPGNAFAYYLSHLPSFGNISQVILEYPQYIPSLEDFQDYSVSKNTKVYGFLDHLCHPLAIMIKFLGKPSSLFYSRNFNGGGTAIFEYQSGQTATLIFTHGAPRNTGIERTSIIGTTGQKIVVENNIRVKSYGFQETSAVKSSIFPPWNLDSQSEEWEPEFSLGRPYNKGLSIMGYIPELLVFCNKILALKSSDSIPTFPEPFHHLNQEGTLEQAHILISIFLAFFKGSQKKVVLSN